LKVLVTGSSGFTGGYVTALLVGAGHEVCGLTRSQTAAERVTRLGAVPVFGDLDEPVTLDEGFATAGAATLVSVASLGFGHAPAIVAAAWEAGITRAVFVSTTAIFTQVAGASKAVRVAAEDTVRASGLEWTIIRPTMVYGAVGDRNMSRLLRLLRRSPVVPLPGRGERLQQPVHVEDLASAIVAAVDRPTAVGRTYNIAGPVGLTLRELLVQAGAAVGRSPHLIPFPLRPTVGAARLCERLALWAPVSAEQLERLTEDKTFDIEAARSDLGFAPRPFAEGIAQEAALC